MKIERNSVGQQGHACFGNAAIPSKTENDSEELNPKSFDQLNVPEGTISSCKNGIYSVRSEGGLFNE